MRFFVFYVTRQFLNPRIPGREHRAINTILSNPILMLLFVFIGVINFMMNFNSDHYVKQMNGGKSKSLNLSLKRFNPSKSSLKRFNPSIRLNPKYKPKLDKFVKFFTPLNI